MQAKTLLSAADIRCYPRRCGNVIYEATIVLEFGTLLAGAVARLGAWRSQGRGAWAEPPLAKGPPPPPGGWRAARYALEFHLQCFSTSDGYGVETLSCRPR